MTHNEITKQRLINKRKDTKQNKYFMNRPDDSLQSLIDGVTKSIEFRVTYFKRGIGTI